MKQILERLSHRNDNIGGRELETIGKSFILRNTKSINIILKIIGFTAIPLTYFGFAASTVTYPVQLIVFFWSLYVFGTSIAYAVNKLKPYSSKDNHQNVYREKFIEIFSDIDLKKVCANLLGNSIICYFYIILIDETKSFINPVLFFIILVINLIMWIYISLSTSESFSFISFILVATFIISVLIILNLLYISYKTTNLGMNFFLMIIAIIMLLHDNKTWRKSKK